MTTTQISSDDKRALVARYLDDNPQMSNREIARQSGVSESWVRTIRKELSPGQEAQTAMTDAEIAEMRLENAAHELERLDTTLRNHRAAIREKEEQIATLHSAHDQARATLEALRTTGERLQDELRDASNRQLIAKGTGHEAEHAAQDRIDQLREAIRLYGEDAHQAETGLHEAEQSLTAIPQLEEDIQSLQSEIELVRSQRREMQELYDEQHMTVGVHRSWALRVSIEAKEQALKEQQAKCEALKKELEEEQKSIPDRLSGWQTLAEGLTATHGLKDAPNTSLDKLEAAWLHFAETLYQEGKSAPAFLDPNNNFVRVRTTQVLEMPEQALIDLANPNNWQSNYATNARGELVSVRTHHRVKQVQSQIAAYRARLARGQF
jgi:DNA repair exonuclease SbcCD ATPase subunit